MKRYLAILFILPRFSSLSPAQGTAIMRYQAKIAVGDYAEALSALNRSLAGRSSPEARASILNQKAAFYETYVGDVDRAAVLYRQVTGLELPVDHAEFLRARSESSRLQALIEEYKEHAALAEGIESLATNEELCERLRDLGACLAAHPQSPFRAAVLHGKGETLLKMDRHAEACRAFDNALREKPAINVSVPTTQLRTVAQGRWATRTSRRVGRVLVGGILLVGMIGFLYVRAWRWLGLRHAIVLASLFGAWFLVLQAGASWIGGTQVFPEETADHVMTSALPANDMAGILDVLRMDGTVGVIGLFIVCTATSGIRLPVTRAVVDSVAGLLLFTGLCMHLVVARCDADFVQNQESDLPFWNGGHHFSNNHLLPFVLMDPAKYPFVNSGKLDEPAVRGFLEEHLGEGRERPQESK